MDSIFEILMDLPLFQGVSRERLSELIEKTPFHFLKYADGEAIAAAGDTCTHIRFIISGEAVAVTSMKSLRVTIKETLSAPAVIGPEFLFGLDTSYPFSITAKGQCGILQITKADYINILHSDKVFLFNVLNILSRKAQHGTMNLLSITSGSIAERLAFIILSLTGNNSSHIAIEYKQKDICSLLSAQRTSFISAMSKLHEEGIIQFTPAEIFVTDRRRLLDILHTRE